MTFLSHFISSYPISEEAFKTFEETGNIGSSPEDLVNILMRKASRRLGYTK